MSTSLFNEIIFGPVKSRRLGISLGINLLPVTSKVCSFNCIYCECGWTVKNHEQKAAFPSREEVKKQLEEKLAEMAAGNELPDVITFAGNGEPTLHPEFEHIIDDTIAVRNRLASKAKIAVLSNATMLHKSSVFNALLKIDDNIQKLDSAFEETVRKIDNPNSHFSLEEVVENLKKFRGKVIIQTLFLRGNYNGEQIDNTTEPEISAWLRLLEEIKPALVMIYAIDRDTPAQGLEKVTVNELQRIASQVKILGLKVQVSG